MHHGTSTTADETVRAHLIDIAFIILRRVLPSALRPVTAGDAYMRGWENAAAAAAGRPTTERVPLWPASAGRYYRRGHGHGASSTADWLAERTPEPAHP